jgi:hypothetical protein
MANVRLLKPSEVDISNGLCGSDFGDSDMETIARNIVILSKKSNDQWTPFSFEQYALGCTHKVSTAEYNILLQMFKSGYLEHSNGVFSITNAFLNVLYPFKDTPERRAKEEKIKADYHAEWEKLQIARAGFLKYLKRYSSNITYKRLEKNAKKFGFEVEMIQREDCVDIRFHEPHHISLISRQGTLDEAVKEAVNHLLGLPSKPFVQCSS